MAHIGIVLLVEIALTQTILELKAHFGCNKNIKIYTVHALK
jgi:hypothetical protein